MKNYLGNLIARHMSQAEVLLPRHASRFEPQSSVLQSDEFQGETAEMDVAETFGVESETVAQMSDAVFVAPVSQIPSEIEHRVANPSLPLSHSPESVVESSGPVPVPAFAELTTPTSAVSDDFGTLIPSKISSAVVSDHHVESTVSGAASDDRVATANRVASVSRMASTTDQIAVHDYVAERALRESGPIAQPFTANETVTTDTPVITNEPLTATEPVITNQSVTANEHEHVTEIERVTPPLRVAATKPNQPLTRRSIETQRAISTPATETERETVGPAVSGESLAPTTRPFASGTKDERFTSGVSYSEDGDISVGLPKPQQPNPPVAIEQSSRERSSIEQSSRERSLIEQSSREHSTIEQSSRERSSIEQPSRELLSAVVVPERTENSPVVNAASESQAAPKHLESLPEEARLPQVAQRARQLETSIARPPVNDPRNVINPGNTRLMPHNGLQFPTGTDITPAEASPTINVTIGRIEVRAATSEPRPQKQRREQQVLSLDEYLNQRSAGGR